MARLDDEEVHGFFYWLVKIGYSEMTSELYVGLVQGMLAVGFEGPDIARGALGRHFAPSTHFNRKMAWRYYLAWLGGLPIWRGKPVPTTEGCIWPGCEQTGRMQRLCRDHFLVFYTAREGGLCTRLGCSRPVTKRDLCRRDFRLWLAGESLESGLTRKRKPNRIEFPDEETAWIWLTDRNGKELDVACIDRADLPRVAHQRWSISRRGKARRPYIVSQASTLGGKPRKVLYLHRMILDPPQGFETDHIDGDPFNNRRSNLRAVTRTQQAQNTTGRGSSGYRNVYPTKAGGWRVSARQGGKYHQAGYFFDLEAAVTAAKALRARLFTHHNEERSGHAEPAPEGDRIQQLSIPLATTSPLLTPRRRVTFQEKTYPSKKALFAAHRLSYSAGMSRLSRGWSLERTLSTPLLSPGRPRKDFD